MTSERIYLDNAAATQVDPQVVEAMMPYFTETYAVASSQFSHTPGIMAKEALETARKQIAENLNVTSEEIVFTSGGTESNNLAIKGVAWSNKEKNHIITSSVENKSVMDSLRWLEKEGFQITKLPVDSEGFVDIKALKSSIDAKTCLVTIQHTNQEVGTLQNVKEIAKICHEHNVAFHTDAQHSFTLTDLDLSKVPADLVTLSSNKIHGPKGVGALFVRNGTSIQGWTHGGYNENNLRGGTENIAGIAGFGKAVELSGSEEVAYLRQLQEKLLNSLKESISGIDVNGPENLEFRLPNNVNVSFQGIEGESVVLHLDMKGISVITGSACFSRSLEPSHVMMSMGFSHERAHGSIRFTLSRFNTEEEIQKTVAACKEIVENLRQISPIKTQE